MAAAQRVPGDAHDRAGTGRSHPSGAFQRLDDRTPAHAASDQDGAAIVVDLEVIERAHPHQHSTGKGT